MSTDQLWLAIVGVLGVVGMVITYVGGRWVERDRWVADVERLDTHAVSDEEFRLKFVARAAQLDTGTGGDDE